jgi:hypothetical protein
MTEPATPGLSFAFRIDAEIGAPLSGGRTARGERLHIPILGGRVEGPRLSGRIVPGGSDWPLIRPDGHSEIAATYTVMADDGTPILVRNAGLRVSEPDVLARLRSGETVSASEYYFRGCPSFEAPDGPHAWLNTRLFVASLAPRRGGVTIDVYTLD